MLLRKMSYWTVPPGVQQFGRSAWHALRSSSAALTSTLARNECWRDYHANDRRCFILAAGPSIKQQDLTLLKGEICIAVSNTFVHKDYSLFQPKYHCVPDMGGHSQVTEEDAVRWFREMETKTGQAVMFLSYDDNALIERNRLFGNREVNYLKFGARWDSQSFETDLTHWVPGVQSVSVMALQIAVFMGFRQIYLLGCDHDWVLHYGTSTHFYPETEHVVTSRPGYSEWHGSDWGLEFQSYATLWAQYKAINPVAQAKSIHIFNATAGGLLDVFPRVRYESIFKSPTDN